MFRKLRDKLEQEVNQRGYSDTMKSIESAVASLANKTTPTTEQAAATIGNGDLNKATEIQSQVEQFSSSIDRALLEESPNHSSDSPLNLLEDDVFSNSNLDSPAILTVSSPEPTSPMVKDQLSSIDSPNMNLVVTEELITFAEPLPTPASPSPTINESQQLAQPSELNQQLESQLRKDNEDLRAQLNQLTQERNMERQQLKTEADTLQRQLKQLREQFDRESLERSKLTDRNSILAEEVNRLQSRDKSERAVRKELQEEIATEKNRTEQSKADLIIANEHLSKLRTKCDQLTRQTQEHSEQNRTFETDRKNFQHRIAELERMLADTDRSSQELSDKFKQERISLKLENSRLKELSITYNNEKQMLADRVADLEKRMNRVNQEYLKNVVFKFVTSVEVDAQRHLIKAISALLDFSDDEDRLAKEMIEWKASWLASLPIVGNHSRPMPAAFSERNNSFDQRS